MTEMGRQPWVVFGLMKTEEQYRQLLLQMKCCSHLLSFTLLYAILGL